MEASCSRWALSEYIPQYYGQFWRVPPRIIPYGKYRSWRDATLALGRRRSLPIRPYLHARITRITSVEQLPQIKDNLVAFGPIWFQLDSIFSPPFFLFSHLFLFSSSLSLSTFATLGSQLSIITQHDMCSVPHVGPSVHNNTNNNNNNNTNNTNNNTSSR